MAKKNFNKTSVDSAAFAAAADQESTPNQLCALAVQSPELARIVAANPAIDASVVELLKKQKDPKVNRALAANPGTPMADLLELGERYTSEFVQNPIFDLALAADPRFIARFTENILKKILTKKRTPETILLWSISNAGKFEFASKYEVYEWVAKTIAERVSISETLASTAATNADDNLRLAIAKRADLSNKWISILSHDTNDNVRLAIANQVDLAEELIIKLADDKYEQVRIAIANQVSLSTALARKLAEDSSSSVRKVIANRTDLSEELARKLAGDSSLWVNLAIANRPDLSQALAIKLAGDREFTVRKAIANRPDLSEELAIKLAGDREFSVLLALACRVDLSEAVACKLLTDLNSEVAREIGQAKRLSQKLVRYLSAHLDKNVRLSIAMRDDLPAYVIARLSIDSDEQVRKVFAPTDLSWCEILRQDPDSAVVTNPELLIAISNTDLPWCVRDIGTGIEMLLIPPGTFQMGDPQDYNYNLRQVKLTKAFYLGRYQVTQAQWQDKTGSNPSHFKDKFDSASRPVEQVSWNDIAGFNTTTGLRLPTEAEWEYACRAGTNTRVHSMPEYPTGTDLKRLIGNVAWFRDNSGKETHVVGGKFANAFGLYDMLGNVFEWCQDWSSDRYNSHLDCVINPSGPQTGSIQKGRGKPCRVLRGGDWSFSYLHCLSGSRNSADCDNRDKCIGFRVARTP
jgi:formylglycine-generating enzyme required for sulfatase activity